MTDLSDDEAFAAEYALGTLDGAERVAAEARRRREPAFDAVVAAWEARLSPLAGVGPEVEPPPAVLAGIMARLPPASAAPGTDQAAALRRRLRAWRGVAVAGCALAAAQALWIAAGSPRAPAPPQQTYTAVLQRGGDAPAFLVSVDLHGRRMSVTPLSMAAPPDKSYELWMIGPGAGAPQSMGILDARGAARPRLPDIDDGAISNATWAVTVEPRGGSPTGQPTSAPVYVGKLIPTAL